MFLLISIHALLYISYVRNFNKRNFDHMRVTRIFNYYRGLLATTPFPCTIRQTTFLLPSEQHLLEQEALEGIDQRVCKTSLKREFPHLRRVTSFRKGKKKRLHAPQEIP